MADSDLNIFTKTVVIIMLVAGCVIACISANNYFHNRAEKFTGYTNIEYNTLYEIYNINKYYNKYGAHYDINFIDIHGVIKTLDINCSKVNVIIDDNIHINYTLITKKDKIIELHLKNKSDIKIVK